MKWKNHPSKQKKMMNCEWVHSIIFKKEKKIRKIELDSVDHTHTHSKEWIINQKKIIKFETIWHQNWQENGTKRREPKSRMNEVSSREEANKGKAMRTNRNIFNVIKIDFDLSQVKREIDSY